MWIGSVSERRFEGAEYRLVFHPRIQVGFPSQNTGWFSIHSSARVFNKGHSELGNTSYDRKEKIYISKQKVESRANAYAFKV